jgi:hypothetical protein
LLPDAKQAAHGVRVQRGVQSGGEALVAHELSLPDEQQAARAVSLPHEAQPFVAALAAHEPKSA